MDNVLSICFLFLFIRDRFSWNYDLITEAKNCYFKVNINSTNESLHMSSKKFYFLEVDLTKLKGLSSGAQHMVIIIMLMAP